MLFFKTMMAVSGAAMICLLVFGKTFYSIPAGTAHPFWLNVFFINYTFIGDGIFASCLVLLVLFYFKKRKLGAALLIALCISFIIVQLLKNIVSGAGLKLFIEPGQYLFINDDINNINYPGLLSSHTMIAFAMATVTLLFIQNGRWQLPLLFAAMLLAYSRMYLVQHNLAEILISASAGTLTGIAAVYLSYRIPAVTPGWDLLRDKKKLRPGIAQPA